MASLPHWRCIKEVDGDLITEIQYDVSRQKHTLILQEFGPREVSWKYINKHEPKVGGYFVVYPDGYESFSPAPAFIDGYVRA